MNPSDKPLAGWRVLVPRGGKWGDAVSATLRGYGAVPVIATFEGADLLNFGASNAAENRDFVTAVVGFRSRLTDSIDAGIAYEIPLTNAHDGILEDRVTVDVVWKF